MRLGDTVCFRNDLLFDGAVQLGWFETDRKRANKAAQHYVFHGPQYHGARGQQMRNTSYALVDTATFLFDTLKRVSSRNSDDPFTMAISGYGTGKSHLALTLSCLLSAAQSSVSSDVLGNLAMADADIGNKTRELLRTVDQSFLVVALNGMQDFDLSVEIIRQVLRVLSEKGLDTTALDSLRPRFRTAIVFTESFFSKLADDFTDVFGPHLGVREITDRLRLQDEETFRRVSDIYQQKLGSPIRAIGQESLHDFMQIVTQTYCGPGKPFAGVVIVFDELGRYMEFAVQKPHVAGSGALQQLFECVQANSDKVFLLGFIQYELNAYVSRVAAERRDELNRYVTRYDAVRKIRLSTNIETLIANLLEKKDVGALEAHFAHVSRNAASTQSSMQRWFPDIANHALWVDQERFDRVICRGCWPLHPCSTWTLFRLTSIGKSLQQRSALSLFADVYRSMEDRCFEPGMSIVPVDLCTQTLIEEFLAAERSGLQGAGAIGYDDVVRRYQTELSDEERLVLKAVLLSSKIGIKVESKQDYMAALAAFCGLEPAAVEIAVHSLEREYAVLSWNDMLNQYEIVGDAIPRSSFLAQLRRRALDIDSPMRARIFAQKYPQWGALDETYDTDFGLANDISTREWRYRILTSELSMLDQLLEFAIGTWTQSIEVGKERGHLIYCYVGPESDVESVKRDTRDRLRSLMVAHGLQLDVGLPLAVVFIHDSDGTFGERIAEHSVLDEQLEGDEDQRHRTFILDRRNSLEQEMQHQFAQLAGNRNMVLGVPKEVGGSRTSEVLNSLFDVIYPKRVPFPFDGFQTARGNAAKDSEDFTRQLFMGSLDRDWITTRSRQQRNRAYDVFDKAWGLLGSDGALRRNPSSPSVEAIAALLDAQLGDEDGDARRLMNMGDAVRLLCRPPYGCNIASAGLLLAYFVGSRKRNVQLLKNNQTIGIDMWLRDAMQGNYLSLPVLDVTEVVRISEESLSEWEDLLDQWESEPTLLGRRDFLQKAADLEKRVATPQDLHYRRQHLQDRSHKAVRALNAVERSIIGACDKIHMGIERDDVARLSWGASDLAECRRVMVNGGVEWIREQLDEVEQMLAAATEKITCRFAQWLPRQRPPSVDGFAGFRHHMRNNVGGNLDKLGLEQERQQLEMYVDLIERDIEFIAEINRATADIRSMVRASIVTDATSFSVLCDWLRQAQQLDRRLDSAQARVDLDQDEVNAAASELGEFMASCQNQLDLYTQRAKSVYADRALSSVNDLVNWRNEVGSLVRMYEGREKDVEDLRSIQVQLELAELHYRQLDDETIDDNQFAALLKQCIAENDAAFCDDEPPLNSDHIYNSIARAISTRREQLATNWMDVTVPKLDDMEMYDAPTAMAYKTRLQSMPPLLSSRQQEIARLALEACDRRLRHLEVQGLLAQFLALSDESKAAFLDRIAEHLETSLSVRLQR